MSKMAEELPRDRIADDDPNNRPDDLPFPDDVIELVHELRRSDALKLTKELQS